MIRINLLPLDEIPRQRVFKMPEVGAFVPVGILVAAVAICATTFFVQQSTMAKLNDDVAEVRAESQRLAPQIARIKQLQRERQQLDERLDAITALDEERYLRVHLMSELARRMPENCWLTRLEESSPGKVEIEGITFSNFIVADFLRDLASGDYYRRLDLVKIERGKIQDVEVLNFHISADVGQPAVQIASDI